MVIWLHFSAITALTAVGSSFRNGRRDRLKLWRRKLLKESMETSVPLKYPTTSKLRFSLNGQLVEVDNPDPRQLLVHWLRQSGYPGTKVSLTCIPYNYFRCKFHKHCSSSDLQNLKDTSIIIRASQNGKRPHSDNKKIQKSGDRSRSPHLLSVFHRSIVEII